MNPFKMQERDLDLFILEELYSDTGFASWLIEKLGLDGFAFETAEHSVSAKAEAKWGETDVLAFFTRGNERIAVLIEDKISASFTDRQAHRYHERAQEIVRDGKANGYRTLLVAPKSYLTGVPKDDPWHHMLAIDEIIAWFEQKEGFHARWRINALNNCTKRARSNLSAGDGEVRRFSAEFAGFLHEHHPEFQHMQTGDSWGLTIKYDRKPTYVDIVWKLSQSFVDLAFAGRHFGKLAHYPEQVGSIRHSTNKTDMLRIPVSTAVWSEPLSDQLDVVNEVIAACQRLRPIAIEVAALPSIIQEAPQLP